MRRVTRELAIPLIIAASLGGSRIARDQDLRARIATSVPTYEHEAVRIAETTWMRVEGYATRLRDLIPGSGDPKTTGSVPTPSAQSAVRIPEPTASASVPAATPIPRPDVRTYVEPAVPLSKPDAHARVPAAKPIPEPSAQAYVEPATPVPKPAAHANVAPSKPIQQPDVRAYVARPTKPSPPPQGVEPSRAASAPTQPTRPARPKLSPWDITAIGRLHALAPLVDLIARERHVNPAVIDGIILNISDAYPDHTGPNGTEGLFGYTTQSFWSMASVGEDGIVRNDPLDPAASLLAYRAQLHRLAMNTQIENIVELETIRRADHTVYDGQAYLTTSTAIRAERSIDASIARATRLLSISDPVVQNSSLVVEKPTVAQAMRYQLEALVDASYHVRGEYRLAYLTTAVSYARVLSDETSVRAALAQARQEADISAGIVTLQARLDYSIEQSAAAPAMPSP